MKGILLLTFALFIDGLQAGISFAAAGLMGPLGGALGATIWCANNLPGGSLVQGACTLVGGAAGAAATPILMPLGIAFGFAINICLSLTMGAGLMLAIHVVFGRQTPWMWGSFIGDMIPGVNNLPFWTLMVLRAWYEDASKRGSLGIWRIASVLTPVRGIMSLKEKTMDLPNMKESLNRVGLQQERAPQPQTGGDLVRMTRTRTPMQDIRVNQKPNVQTA